MKTFFVCVLAAVAGFTGCGGDSGSSTSSSSKLGFRELEAIPLDLPTIEVPGPPISNGLAGRCFSADVTEVGAIGLPGFPGEGELGPAGSRSELERGPIYVGLRAGPPRIAHLTSAQPIEKSPWKAIETIWISRPPYEGPVLVRGGRIEAPGDLGFGSRVRPRPSLRLPAGTWSEVGEDPPLGKRPLRDGWRATSVPTRIKVPGCYAFQVDGEGFSYLLSFGVQAE